MSRYLATLLGLFLCLAGLQPAAAAPRTMTLSGKIVAATTNRPIRYASVTLAGRTFTTAGDGRFKASIKAEPGDQDLIVMANGYDRWQSAVSMTKPTTSVTIRLTQLLNTGLAAIGGVIRDGVTGKPVANALVSVGQQTVETDLSGKYEIRNIAPGEETVRIRASEYFSEDIAWFFHPNNRATGGVSIHPEPPVGRVDAFRTGNGTIWRLIHDPVHNRVMVGTFESQVGSIYTPTGTVSRPMSYNGGPITALAYSPDGKNLAVAVNQKVWFMPQISGRADDPINVDAQAVAFDGNDTLIVGEFDGSLSRWNTKTGQRLQRTPSGDQLIIRLSLSGDHRTVASLDYSGKVRLWDASTLKPIKELKASWSAYEIGLSADGRQLFALISNGQVAMIDVESDTIMAKAPIPNHTARRIHLVQPWLLAIGTEEGVMLWDVLQQRISANFKIGSAWRLTTSQDGRYLYWAGINSTLYRVRLKP